jgi:hypothetical protein
LAPYTPIRASPERKYSHSSASGCQCSSRVPGLDLDQGRGNRLGCLERPRVNDAEAASLRPDRLLGEQVVGEGLGDRPGAGDPLRAERAGHRRIEDVELVVGEVSKGALGHLEVLGENLPWRMRQPVREQKARVLVELAVVGDEQHLAAVVGEALDRVRDTAGKYQTSPSLTSSWNVRSSGSTAVIRARPAIM